MLYPDPLIALFAHFPPIFAFPAASASAFPSTVVSLVVIRSINRMLSASIFRMSLFWLLLYCKHYVSERVWLDHLVPSPWHRRVPFSSSQMLLLTVLSSVTLSTNIPSFARYLKLNLVCNPPCHRHVPSAECTINNRQNLSFQFSPPCKYHE